MDETDGITIISLTDIGEATIRILGFNAAHRLQERRIQRDLEEALHAISDAA